jgi:Peptidase family M23
MSYRTGRLWKAATALLLALAVSFAVLGVARATHPTSVPKPGWYAVGGSKADLTLSEGEGHLATWENVKLYKNGTWRAYWYIQNVSNKPITVGCKGYQHHGGLDGYKANISYPSYHRTYTAFDAKCHQLGGGHRETLQPDEFTQSWAHFEKSEQGVKCIQITLPTGKNVPPHKGYTKCVNPYKHYIGSSVEADHYRLPFVGEYGISNGPQCGPTHGQDSKPGSIYEPSKEAIDFKTPVGTPIYAARAGTIDAALEHTTGFGKHIIIKHDNVKEPSNVEWSYYAHLSSFAKTTGGVTQGELIGYSGATGNTGKPPGPHLHFEVRDDSGDRKDYPEDTDKAVSIRYIPGIFWYNGKPDDPCRPGQDDGVAFGPPL